MAEVRFSNTLSKEDREVVSLNTLEIIKKAAEDSNNPIVTITSTLRTPERQARAMFDNLSRGVRIRYKAPGQMVTELYDDLANDGNPSEVTIKAMADMIAKLAGDGMLVSKHCVTPDIYAQCNILDLSKSMPNPRDFAGALAKCTRTNRIITPLTPLGDEYGHYMPAVINIDKSEPAIHVEIVPPAATEDIVWD